MEKRQKGRPKKKADSMEAWQFGRAAIVMCAYDESREKGEKHSVAVTDAVDAVKQCSPQTPISESEVKRILSMFRPRESVTILRFGRTPLSEEDFNRYRWLREQLAELQEKKGITLPQLPDYDEPRRREKFTIRFSERPDYPRYNRRAPKE